MRCIVRYLVLLGAAASIAGCDRVTKHVATETLAGEPVRSYFFDTVRLIYAENTGSFLSVGAGLPNFVRFTVFVVGAGLLLVFLVLYAVRSRWAGRKLFAVALIVGGGTSNLVDRLIDGRVVDFLNVGIGPIRTGIFNVADMALLAGLVLLTATSYWQARKRVDGQSGHL